MAQHQCIWQVHMASAYGKCMACVACHDKEATALDQALPVTWLLLDWLYPDCLMYSLVCTQLLRLMPKIEKAGTEDWEQLQLVQLLACTTPANPNSVHCEEAG